MERGGITRLRAYLLLVGLLLLALLAALYCTRMPKGDVAQAMPADTTLPSEPQQPRQYSRPDRYSTQSYRRYSTQANGFSHDDTRRLNGTPQQSAARAAKLVELNEADSLDLIQLYNIGPAFARRIIRYRALLGGFVAKEQLMEVYGMDSARYYDIAPHIAIDAGKITTLDVNTATLDQLKRHPYLDYYQARAIVRQREAAGAYHDISDLKTIALIDNDTYNKILPYLVCNLQPSK